MKIFKRFYFWLPVASVSIGLFITNCEMLACVPVLISSPSLWIMEWYGTYNMTVFNFPFNAILFNLIFWAIFGWSIDRAIKISKTKNYNDKHKSLTIIAPFLIIIIVITIVYSHSSYIRKGYLCEQVEPITSSGISDRCYSTKASRLQDSAVCDKIKSLSRKNKCLARITKNIEYCGRITEVDSKDDCYLDSASEKEDENICSLVSSENAKSKCFFLTALKRKDKNICSLIRQDSYKSECLNYFPSE